MTKIIIRLFGYQPAQNVLTRKDNIGRHWYMAADICRLLGIVGYSQAVKQHLLGSEWKKETLYTGTSRRHLLLINDSGVYKLIQIAKSESAQEIQERARRVTAPLRPTSWPEEQVVA